MKCSTCKRLFWYALAPSYSHLPSFPHLVNKRELGNPVLARRNPQRLRKWVGYKLKTVFLIFRANLIKSKITFNIFAESKEQIVSFTSYQTALRTRPAITQSLRVISVNARGKEVKGLLNVIFRACSFLTPSVNWKRKEIQILLKNFRELEQEKETLFTATT